MMEGGDKSPFEDELQFVPEEEVSRLGTPRFSSRLALNQRFFFYLKIN